MRCATCHFLTRRSPCAVCQSGVAVQHLVGLMPTLAGLATRGLSPTSTMHRRPKEPASGRPSVHSKQSILDAVVAWMQRHPDRPLTSTQYKRAEGLPSINAVNKHWGGVAALRAAALKQLGSAV